MNNLTTVNMNIFRTANIVKVTELYQSNLSVTNQIKYVQ